MSEHGRAVETFIHDFKVRNSAANLEEIDVDSSEGTALVSLYDIVQYPAILVLTGDGALLNSWQGTELPLINEVAAYAYGG